MKQSSKLWFRAAVAAALIAGGVSQLADAAVSQKEETSEGEKQLELLELQGKNKEAGHVGAAYAGLSAMAAGETAPGQTAEQNTVVNEHGFYVNNGKGTYNVLTDDGLAVGGTGNDTGFRINNEGNVYSSGTASFDGRVTAKDGLAVGGFLIDGTDVKAGNNFIVSGNNGQAVGNVKNAGNSIIISTLGNTDKGGGPTTVQNTNETVAIGNGVKVTVDEALAKGEGAHWYHANTAIGTHASAVNSGEGVALGSEASLKNVVAGTAIGYGAAVENTEEYLKNGGSRETYGIAIGGWSSVKDAPYGVAIGAQASTTGKSGVALGVLSNSSAQSALALGNSSAASGKYSVALGAGANASAQNGLAFGNQSKASTTDSVAIGAGSKASGIGAVALGSSSEASSMTSVALGNHSKASALSSVALGNYSEASARNTVALGYKSEASGLNSFALGALSKASEDATNSFALGYNAQAQKGWSVALGSNSKANAENSVAIGNYSVADEAYTVSVGSRTSFRRITNVEDGKNAHDAVNKGQLDTVINEYKAADTAIVENYKKYGLIGGVTMENGDIAGATATIGNVAIGSKKSDAINVGNGKFVVYDDGAFTAASRKFIVKKDGSVTVSSLAADGKVTAGSADIGNLHVGDYGVNVNGKFQVNASDGKASILVSDPFTFQGKTAPSQVQISGNIMALGNGTDTVFQINGYKSVTIDGDEVITSSKFAPVVGRLDEVSEEAKKKTTVSAGDNNVEVTKDGLDYKVGLADTIQVKSLTADGKVDIGGWTFENGNISVAGLTGKTLTIGDASYNLTGLPGLLEIASAPDWASAMKNKDTKEFLSDSVKAFVEEGRLTGKTASVGGFLIDGTDVKAGNNFIVSGNNGQAVGNVKNAGNSIIISTLGNTDKGGGPTTVQNTNETVAIGNGVKVTVDEALAKGEGAHWYHANTAIGTHASAVNSGEGVALGSEASLKNVVAGTAIGYGAAVENTEEYLKNGGSRETYGIAIGGWSSVKDAPYGVAIGAQASTTGKSGVALGVLSNSSAQSALALGNSSAASGAYSVALGDHANASEKSALSLGYHSAASGEFSVALGDSSAASNRYSVALGAHANAFGYDALSLGGFSAASQYGAVAIGSVSKASGEYSAAIGVLSNASAKNALAFGNSSAASGESSVALGDHAEASAKNSVAIGNGSLADEAYTVSVGNSTSFRRITHVADGIGDHDAVTVGQFNGAKKSNFIKDAVGKIDWKAVGEKADAINAAVAKLSSRTVADAAAFSLKSASFSMAKTAGAPSLLADTDGNGNSVNRDPSSGTSGETSGVVVDDSGNSIVNKNLIVKGDSTFEGNAAVNKDLTVGGTTSLKNTTVDGSLTIKDGDKTLNVADRINENTSAIQQNSNFIDFLSQDVNRLGGEIDSVGALSAALAGMHPLAYDPSEAKYQISAALGGYDGSYAAALGGFYHVNKDILLSFGVSSILQGQRKTMGNIGATFRIGAGPKEQAPAAEAGSQADILRRLAEMDQKISALEQENKELKEQIAAQAK